MGRKGPLHTLITPATQSRYTVGCPHQYPTGVVDTGQTTLDSLNRGRATRVGWLCFSFLFFSLFFFTLSQTLPIVNYCRRVFDCDVDVDFRGTWLHDDVSGTPVGKTRKWKVDFINSHRSQKLKDRKRRSSTSLQGTHYITPTYGSITDPRGSKFSRTSRYTECLFSGRVFACQQLASATVFENLWK